MRRRFLLVLIGLLFVSCQPTLKQQQRRVDRLSRSFSTLEQLRVEGYGNQEWCRYITYRRGRFAEKLQSWNCNLFRETPQPFDAQAQQDFEQVEQAIAVAGFKVDSIRDIKHEPGGAIVGATFSLRSAGTYVYAPAYKALPAGIPNELEYVPINQDWYLVRMVDWN